MTYARPMVVSIRGLTVLQLTLLRVKDSNLRPLGYEPNKLPTALTRDIILKNVFKINEGERKLYNLSKSHNQPKVS